MSASASEILSSYRALYKQALRTIKYSEPARIILRDKIRQAFRESPASDHDPVRIARTIDFLRIAQQKRGIANRIVKNLVHIRWGEYRNPTKHWRSKTRRTTIDYHQMADQRIRDTVAKLNETMNLCLR